MLSLPPSRPLPPRPQGAQGAGGLPANLAAFQPTINGSAIEVRPPASCSLSGAAFSPARLLGACSRKLRWGCLKAPLASSSLPPTHSSLTPCRCASAPKTPPTTTAPAPVRAHACARSWATERAARLRCAPWAGSRIGMWAAGCAVHAVAGVTHPCQQPLGARASPSSRHAQACWGWWPGPPRPSPASTPGWRLGWRCRVRPGGGGGGAAWGVQQQQQRALACTSGIRLGACRPGLGVEAQLQAAGCAPAHSIWPPTRPSCPPLAQTLPAGCPPNPLPQPFMTRCWLS